MNSLGQYFRMTTYGESHGAGIGVVIDGCPAGVMIDESFIHHELQRRRPGQSRITTQRREHEDFSIQSGVFEGQSTGAPINIFIPNQDAKSKDYSHVKDTFRPSHADYTYETKYGLRDYRGGGRSSARITAGWVAAGAIAKMILQMQAIKVQAYVAAVGYIVAPEHETLDLSLTETNDVRCPDPATAEKMFNFIDSVRKDGDTVGGLVTGTILNVPAGIGEPLFDKLHARLGHALFSINAVKGVEFGSGFQSATMRGSAHNDAIYQEGGTTRTRTNHSGGIQGGISNGEEIIFRVAFKPVATLMKDQESVDRSGETTVVKGKGRHDPCVVPRAVPIVEALTAITLVDLIFADKLAKI